MTRLSVVLKKEFDINLYSYFWFRKHKMPFNIASVIASQQKNVFITVNKSVGRFVYLH